MGIVAIHTAVDILDLVFDQEILVLEIVALPAQRLVRQIGPTLVGRVAVEAVLKHLVRIFRIQGISLVLVLVFYLFIIVADSLSKNPAAQPHLIMWLPVVISLAFGARMIRRWE